MAKEAGTELNSKMLVRYALKGMAVSLVVMLGIILYTFDPKETIGALRNFPVSFIPLMLLLVFGSWFCSGARLWVLSSALGYRINLAQGLLTAMAAEFGVAATPGGVGGTVIRLLYMKKGGVPLTVGASILTADAVLDVSFFVVLIPVALTIMSNVPSWSGVFDEFRKIPLSLVVAVAVVLVALIVVLLKRGGALIRLLEEKLEYIEMANKKRLASRLRYVRWKTRNAFVRIIGTTKFMFRKHGFALCAAFILTGIQWLCRYGLLPVVLMAFSGDVSFIPLIVMQGLMLAASFMIVLPGGGGAVEGLTKAVLDQFVSSPTAAIVMTICRIFTYWLYLLAGGAVFLLTWGNLDRIFPPEKGLFADRD